MRRPTAALLIACLSSVSAACATAQTPEASPVPAGQRGQAPERLRTTKHSHISVSTKSHHLTWQGTARVDWMSADEAREWLGIDTEPELGDLE
jgi:hypothetical protein